MAGNVLDLTSRLKTKAHNTENINQIDNKVIDITEKRAEVLKGERRQVRRTILHEFISVHTVVPGMGLMRVLLYDINQRGISFDMEESRGRFQVGEELAMRVYLNHQTYFPFTVRVRYVNEVKEEGVFRHGAEIVPETLNQKALEHFIGFLENISAALRYDGGDVMVSNIFPKS